MDNDREEIAFTRDIAKAVSKDLGISEEKALYHIDFMVHWIKKLSKDPEVLNIYLPKIGQMYINMSRVEKDYNHFSALKEEELSTSWKTQLERHRLRLEAFNEEFPNLTGYNRHKKRTKITNRWFNKGMNFEELEVWQNK